MASIERRVLLAHCEASSQFESKIEARRLIGRAFRSRTAKDPNLTSALAELAALRHYPKAKANLGLVGIDFRVGWRRFEVKSICGRNNKFLLNRVSHDTQFEYSKPPHFYVFVRIRELAFNLSAGIRIAYRVKVLSANELDNALRRLRRRRGHLPMFKHYVRLLPSDLGFPPEARGRHVSHFLNAE